ncbi:hypothetical protein [Mycolicibacterium goodii]|uniref:hypothetical protein n=1 Tax=Mycolicibacterium goodii TaxID=134601 RepID=UPI001BDD69D7|nr:hypothetical protein [Mycolicibacterium goodii]MBU8839133.1 hypothetical protein [Mycolicibacterium goodii]
MTIPVTLHPDAERRAELLMSRYATLTEGNPGFHYHWHMRALEHGTADADSVTEALVDGGDRLEDLRRLVSDDQTYQMWRVRLEHPHWWIGTRVRSTTSLLAQIISELTQDQGTGFHAGISGYPGAHWFTQTKEAIQPLSEPSKEILAATLHRELQGRQVCMAAKLFDDIDASAVFPESESDTAFDGADLTEAIAAIEAVHGAAWADAFKTMLEDLDPITWPGLAESLVTERRTVR